MTASLSNVHLCYSCLPITSWSHLDVLLLKNIPPFDNGNDFQHRDCIFNEDVLKKNHATQSIYT